ncbi:MAG: VWA domain-containing protein, partial [Acidimicrobiia bacterium]|nr:VWA domain-containing protein [Acidimicrobiia bacterium]
MRRRLTRLLLVVFLVLLVAAPAAAETSTDPPRVVYVDARDTEAQLGVLAESYEVSAGDIKIEQSGESLAVRDLTSAQQESWPVEMVFVVDLDNRNAANGGMTRAASAIAAAAESLPDGSRVGLVSAGRVADVEIPLTTSLDRLDIGLSQLGIDKGSALLDAAGTAGRMFDSADSGLGRQVVRTVVVVTGGPDTSSVNDREAAASGLIQNSAQLIVVNIGVPSAELAEMAGTVGGSSVDGTP